jgi:hypothetical protein
MAFVRASVLREALKVTRLSTSVARPQVWRQIGSRGYATHGHEAKKAGGDLPWYVKANPAKFPINYQADGTLNRAIGAVVVTVPTCWYLLQQKPESHGHNSHGVSHRKEHGKEHHEEKSKDEPEAAADSKDDESDSEKSDDSGSGDEGKGADTPDTSDDEGDGKVRKQGKAEDASIDKACFMIARLHALI